MSQGCLDEPLLPTATPDTFAVERSPSRRRKDALTASIALNVTLLILTAVSLRGVASPLDVYTPTADVLEYIPRRFNHALYKSAYNGKPSTALDEKWEALYHSGLMQIPRSQASLFTNKTAPIPGDEENYIFSFDVFHQLHCLNLIRQALHPEYYTEAYYTERGRLNPLKMTEENGDFDHLGHCVDSLRESLTCSADVTPIIWVWDERQQRTMPRLDVVHNCRNYGKIQEWADAHMIRTSSDATVHVEG